MHCILCTVLVKNKEKKSKLKFGNIFPIHGAISRTTEPIRDLHEFILYIFLLNSDMVKKIEIVLLLFFFFKDDLSVVNNPMERVG